MSAEPAFRAKRTFRLGVVVLVASFWATLAGAEWPSGGEVGEANTQAPGAVASKVANVADPSLARQGRWLFLGQQTFAAGDAITSQSLPAAMVACAACHGARAQGQREGGRLAPPLRWSNLSQARDGLPGYADVAALRKAIVHGVGRGGQPLDPAMPRFSNISDVEWQALLEHLRWAGSAGDQALGVAPSELVFGTVLPLSGLGAAAGRQVLAGLRGVFDQVNARGGVHGRQIRLIAADGAAQRDASAETKAPGPDVSNDASELRLLTGQRPSKLGSPVHGAPPAATRVHAALRSLWVQPVYALVGGLWDEDQAQVEPWLAAAQWPHIGTLVRRSRSVGAQDWSVDLLPPLSLQYEALQHALVGCEAPRRLAVLDDTQSSSPTAATGAPFGSGQVGSDAEVQWLSTGMLADSVQAGHSPACIAYLLAQASRVKELVPEGWRQSVVLPMPLALVIPRQDETRIALWQRLGEQAAWLAVDLLGRAGRGLHERALLDELQGLDEPAANSARLPMRFQRQQRHAWSPEVLSWNINPATAVVQGD